MTKLGHPGVMQRDLARDVPASATWYSRFGKRALDLVLGLVGMLILACLYVPVALAIRIDSPGPVLFRQERKGQHQRPFALLKFRSMRAGTPFMSYRDAAHKAELYVTRTGALLRSTSLDELPQVINVMRGEMSIVGPRPESLNAVPCEGDEEERFTVKPGITGLAQVRGRNAVEIHARRAMDVEYARTMTLGKDLWILWRTVVTLVRRENIYNEPEKQ